MLTHSLVVQDLPSDEIGLTLEKSTAYRASLPMPKHVRSSSSAEVSRETTENLYELGLLNRPPSKPHSHTNDPKTAHCMRPLTISPSLTAHIPFTVHLCRPATD